MRPISIHSNANPSYRLLQLPTPDIMAFATAGSVLLYSLSERKVNQIIFPKNVEATKNIETGPCTAFHYFNEKGRVMIGTAGGWLFEMERAEAGWKVISSLKCGVAVTGIVDGIPVLGDGRVGLGQKGIKFPPKHRIEVGIRLDRQLYALGSVDKQIHIYSNKDQQWQYYNSLQGHADSVQSLASISYKGQIWLASGSKDGVIRLWVLTKGTKQEYLKNQYQVEGYGWIRLESVLYGHEGNVSGLDWVAVQKGVVLVSCSFDKTVQIWISDGDGFWSSRVRLGQMSGSKNAFFAVSAHRGRICSLTFTGSIYSWTFDSQLSHFQSEMLISGHSQEIMDIDIDKAEQRIVSCSADQSTRVYGMIKGGRWVQLSRAQVHGWNLKSAKFASPSIAGLPSAPTASQLLLTGAQQKILRLLQPPARYLNLSNTLTMDSQTLPSHDPQLVVCQDPLRYRVVKEGGGQALGLMIRNIKVEEEQEQDAFGARDQQYQKIPDEDYLLRNTLWPERAKLYGHPNEISAICVHSSQPIFATSCRALNKQESAIILWQNLKIVKRFEAHRSTVTAIAMQQGIMASVSKDRQLALYDLKALEIKHVSTVHARQINFVRLLGGFVLTGSKDKSIRLGVAGSDKSVNLGFKCNVSAGEWVQKSRAFIGLQNGDIVVIKIDTVGLALQVISVHENYHSDRINQIVIRRNLMATGGADNILRIYQIDSLAAE